MEKLILAAMLKSRSAYETFERLGDRGLFSPIGSLCFAAIDEYYRSDSGSGSANAELIEARLLRDVKNPKHEGPIKEYLAGLAVDVSTVNVEHEIRALYKQRVGGKLSLALANGAPDVEVEKLLAEYQRAETAGGGSPTSRPGLGGLVDVLDTSDMVAEQENVRYIKLWPKALNDRLEGGALRGHHILVYARPETGKTLFAINLTAGFLHQNLNVLYVASEEPVADIRDRIRGRLLKVSRADIRGADRASHAERLAKVSLGELRVSGDSTTFAAVREHLRAGPGKGLKFDVLIIDQLQKMRLKHDSKTEQLAAASSEARLIAKEYDVLVVSLTQAGDSATNKVFLEQNDVHASKTDIPGEMDLMVGLGSDDATRANNLLGVSLPKNKLSGLHDKFMVTTNLQTGVIT